MPNCMRPPRNMGRASEGGVILAGKDGIDTIEQALADAEIWVPIVVASKSPSVREVVDTIRAGAFDYLELPLDSSQVKRVVHATHSEGAYVIEARLAGMPQRKESDVFQAVN